MKKTFGMVLIGFFSVCCMIIAGCGGGGGGSVVNNAGGGGTTVTEPVVPDQAISGINTTLNRQTPETAEYNACQSFARLLSTHQNNTTLKNIIRNIETIDLGFRRSTPVLRAVSFICGAGASVLRTTSGSTVTEVQDNIIAYVVPIIDQILEILYVADNYENFSLTFYPSDFNSQTGSDQGMTIKIADILLAEGGLLCLRGGLYLVCAFDLEPSQTPGQVRTSFGMTHQDTNKGMGRLKTGLDNLKEGMNLIIQGLTKAKAGRSGLLVGEDAPTAEQYDEAISYANKLYQSLCGTDVTVEPPDSNKPSFKLNLRAWYNLQKVDFHDFVYLDVLAAGTKNFGDAGTIKDYTFGGVFPDMTEQKFNQLRQ